MQPKLWLCAPLHHFSLPAKPPPQFKPKSWFPAAKHEFEIQIHFHHHQSIYTTITGRRNLAGGLLPPPRATFFGVRAAHLAAFSSNPSISLCSLPAKISHGSSHLFLLLCPHCSHKINLSSLCFFPILSKPLLLPCLPLCHHHITTAAALSRCSSPTITAHSIGHF